MKKFSFALLIVIILMLVISYNTLAAEITVAPLIEDVTVTNNAGIADAIRVIGLTYGDIVYVYRQQSDGTAVATATVTSGKTEVKISINQLSETEGKIYISKKSKDMIESQRIEIYYIAEQTTGAPISDNITVTNNAGAKDTVLVTGLISGDIIYIYKDLTGGTAIGKATVQIGKTQATVSISQLGSTSGTIYVSIKGYSKKESSRVEQTYIAELVTQQLSEEVISITNYAGISDLVKVTGLTARDTVKVYRQQTEGLAIGTATVSLGKTEATVKISQISELEGNVYVSLTSKNKLESTRIEVSYLAEEESTDLLEETISIINLSGYSDLITVTELEHGDVVKVYNSENQGTLLGKATVSIGKTETTVSIKQLGTTSGVTYVTKTQYGKKESARVEKTYGPEVVSDIPIEDNIYVRNNAGVSDIVVVYGLNIGDVVKVYLSEDSTTAIGTATVKSFVTVVSVKQFPEDSGSIYVSVINRGKIESSRVQAYYYEETTSFPLILENVVIVNNIDQDIIMVHGLMQNDTIKVYSDSEEEILIKKATVAQGQRHVIINIKQLGIHGGNVWISLTSYGRKESTKILVQFEPEYRFINQAGDAILVT